MKNLKNQYYTKDIQLPNEKIQKLVASSYLKKSMKQVDNSDVNINHLENIFTDENFYLAMKLVPLLERKVLYLSYIENIKLNDVCRRLKISKNEVITLRSKAIVHFKHNLEMLYKIQRVKKGE